MSGFLRTLHGLSVVSLGGLIVLLAAWVLALDPAPPVLQAAALLVLALPLLLALPGVLRARRYTLAWSALLILAYFVHGTAYVAGPGVGRFLGALELALVAIYLASSMTFLRYARSL